MNISVYVIKSPSRGFQKELRVAGVYVYMYLSFLHFLLISYGNQGENNKNFYFNWQIECIALVYRWKFTTWVGVKAVLKTTQHSPNVIDTIKKFKIQKLKILFGHKCVLAGENCVSKIEIRNF